MLSLRYCEKLSAGTMYPVHGGYLWFHGGYPWVLGGYLGSGWLSCWVGKSGRWVGQMGGQIRWLGMSGG